MSIIANINKNGTAETSRFISIESNYRDYVKNLKSTFTNCTNQGGSDHFISTFNEIDSAVLKYGNNPANLPRVMTDIQNSEQLYKWASAVICSMIYAFDGDNSLSIQGIPFETVDAVGNRTAIEKTEFLRVWREKFETDGTNSNESDPTYTVNGNLTPYASASSLNVISFSDDTDYENVIGCFSNRYFVVPMKEYKLSTKKNSSLWRKKFFEMCENHERLAEYINNLNVRQKVLINLSASSIQTTAPEPLKLIQAIVQKYADISQFGISISQLNTIPAFKTVSGIKFYKTSSVIDLDSILSSTLFMGIDRIGNQNVYRATYPITDVLVQGLKNGGSYIDNVHFEVTPDTTKTNAVSEAVFSFNYYDSLVFLSPSTAVTAGNNDIKYQYSVKKTYGISDIKNITKLQTMCMFPNLPSKYENRCSHYTYFSLDQAYILPVPISNAKETIDLSNGIFRGVTGSDGQKQTIIKKDVKDGNFNTKNTPNGKVFTSVATVPEHFIEVCDQNGNNCGYSLNIRTDIGDIPALLTSNSGTGDKIQTCTPEASGNSSLYSFVDFGSSSSCIKYRINNGALIENTVMNRCTVRTFLAEYFKKDYNYVINDPEINNLTKFMSISTVYDEVSGVDSYFIYKDAWTPVTNSLSEYKDPVIKTSPSNKTKIVDSAGVQSPNIIVNSLCYTIACNAVSNGCSDVYIVPSLPSSDYKDNLVSIWNSAIKNTAVIFPNLTMHNTLNTNDIQCLFESVAVSNGTQKIPANHMMISIDMGDGTTDMSAIISDTIGKNISMCGHASIEYAGKNLIKTTIRDILENMPKSFAEKMLKGDLSYSDSLFTPFDNTNKGKQEYDARIKALIDTFFNGNTLINQKDDAWENKVMDVLSISNLGKGIDQKVAGNLIVRYMILMPVVKDFINTAIKIAGDKFTKSTTIKINFVGGASKGLWLFSEIDSRNGAKSDTILKNYFTKAFPDNVVGFSGISPTKDDGKDILIDGLEKIEITNIGGGFKLVAPIKLTDGDWDKVNPKNISDLGDSIHQNSLNVPFTSINEQNQDTEVARLKNLSVISSPQSYYKGYPDDADSPFNEFADYFNNEIYKKLIDDGNGKPDTIEILIKNFVKNASADMKDAITREVLNASEGNSFYRATNSSIYPEMMKNAIFMFTLSKLLSEFHGGFRQDHIIKSVGDVPDYTFGG